MQRGFLRTPLATWWWIIISPDVVPETSKGFEDNPNGFSVESASIAAVVARQKPVLNLALGAIAVTSKRKRVLSLAESRMRARAHNYAGVWLGKGREARALELLQRLWSLDWNG